MTGIFLVVIRIKPTSDIFERLHEHEKATVTVMIIPKKTSKDSHVSPGMKFLLRCFGQSYQEDITSEKFATGRPTCVVTSIEHCIT
jgi:hypothetical protein